MNRTLKTKEISSPLFLFLMALFLYPGNHITMASESIVLQPEEISMQQQMQNISGIVLDTRGEAIIGASIIEKNTSNGTITDLDGRFSLNVNPNAILVISYIGYKPEEVKAQPNLRIVMKEDTELLDEVVVVGFGVQKKANLTGAVSSVDVSKTIESRPISDIGRALQGAMPGVNVSTRSGEIGTSPTIKIRGSVGSPNGDSKPLILVDNVEISDLSLVNPDDVESISVLKDAASSTIYGARAAFGVILITTKSKQMNESFTVKYSNNFAWRTPTTNSKQLPGWQQAEINLAGEQAAGNSYYTIVGNMIVDQKAVDGMKSWYEQYGNGKGLDQEMVYGRDFEIDASGSRFYRSWDWYDMFVKDWMPQQSHNISVSGGTGKTSYGITLGYLWQEGLTKKNPDTFDRYNIGLNLNSEVNKYVRLRANTLYTKTDLAKPFVYNANQLYDYLYYLYRWQPVYPYGTYEGKPFRSALTDLDQASMTHNKTDYMRLGGGITITPIKDLTIDFDLIYTSTEKRYNLNGGPIYGYDVFSAHTSLESLVGSYGNYAAVATNYVREERRRTQMLTNNIVATYSKRFKEHDFKFMAGSNIEESSFRYVWAKKMNLLSADKPELGLAIGEATVGSEHTSWAVAGFFGRINYAYKDRYLLEVNGRYDGSSRFPKNQRFAFFPSVSAGYRITEEEFMKFLQPTLSTLKFRGSYGTIGNQDVGLNKFISTMDGRSVNWVINGSQQTAMTTPQVVSNSLTWETVKTIDVGFDMRMFDDKLGVTFDWYDRTTSDVLTSPNLPTVLGADSPAQNLGAIQTKGWEVGLDFRHQFNNGLAISLGGQITDYKTKVSKWTENTIMPTYGTYGQGWFATTTSYKKGMVLGDIWGLKVDRLLQESDFDANGNLLPHIPDQTAIFGSTYQFAPGDVLYKDLDKSGSITKGATTDEPGDYTVIGNTLPRYEYGFNLGAEYKNFDFHIFFQGVGKRHLWAMGNQVLPGFTSGEPYYKGADDYWRPDNTDAFYPRPYIYSQTATGNYTVNDRYLLNMAYLRCKTLSIGYTLPKSLLSKVYVKNLRVYFTAENLFEFTKVKPDIDPETDVRYVETSADQRNFGRTYPYQRTLSFGLQLTL